jgi:hypothetical protein
MAVATIERTFLWGSELVEPLGEADLRGPRAGHGLGWHTLLAVITGARYP